MRPLLERTPRGADARAARRARADDRSRRSSAAARVARLTGANHTLGAIVAGGASTRFHGEPKGLHTVGGRRILDRVVSALSRVVDDWILVANSDDAERWLPGARVVRDSRPERGSIIGIHTALTYAQNHGHDQALVVAWDMPFLSADLIRDIVDRPFAAPATIPLGPHGPEPFCAVYNRTLLRHLNAMIDRGELRVRTLMEQPMLPVTIPERDIARFGDPARLFFNVNTADDLAKAEAMAREE